jgi:hypothetical protein
LVAPGRLNVHSEAVCSRRGVGHRHMCRRPRASLSGRLVGRDLLDLRRERAFGCSEIEARLNVHPERSAGLEEFAEPQRSVGRNELFFARDAFDPGARQVQRGRVRCQLERYEKFFPQDLAGMNRRKSWDRSQRTSL